MKEIDWWSVLENQKDYLRDAMKMERQFDPEDERNPYVFDVFYLQERIGLIEQGCYDEAYFNQMKRRLFTKDNEYYKQWSHLGESDVNWYYVDGEWRYYRGGKRIASVSGE